MGWLLSILVHHQTARKQQPCLLFCPLATVIQRYTASDGGGLTSKVLPAHSLHPLCCLTGHVNPLHHFQGCLLHVQMLVEAVAVTPLGDDGKAGPGHEAHEEQDVHVACFSGGGKRDCQKHPGQCSRLLLLR